MSAEQDIVTLRARVAELERKLDFLYRKLGIEFFDEPGMVNTQVMALLKKGNKIEAIKLYRDLTNAGLAEAKQAVERMEASIL
ncbi:MAG: ribosomal protein L7/L12 [Anaerolineales bacterium]|jgi:ribosomal protein L7/L12|nr:ribosomal protein L7/L12 [Chloroflexota bacterium]MBK6644485.1 ribosomal protein L7/L12 [Anaerolineales bacterium]MCC6985603.1 ribosomal protein L7/L12 [Anaerolineales bacterium]